MTELAGHGSEYGEDCNFRPISCESRDIDDQLALDAVRARTFLCVVCRENIVSPADGEDTCPACLP